MISLIYKQYDCFVLLIEYGCPLNVDIYNYLVEFNISTKYLEFLIKNKRIKYKSFILERAIINNNYDCLKLLIKNKFPISDQAYINTLGKIDNKFLKLLIKTKRPVNGKFTRYAALEKNILTLKLLINNGCPWSKKLLKYKFIDNTCKQYLISLLKKKNDL